MARRKKVIESEQQYNAAIMEQQKADYIIGLVDEGQQYMDQFKNKWDDINSKIRTEEPAEWNDKEKWQTRVVVPMFAKGSEVGMSYMNKMCFGSKRFYSIWGTKSELNKYCTPLMDLIDAILDRGRFNFNKNFALQEAIDIGTSFIKPLVRPDKRGIDFPWVSAYACFCDVGARHDFYKSRMWSHNYSYDLHQMIDDVRQGPNALWTREGINKLIDIGVGEANTLIEEQPTKSEENLSVVQNIDGTAQMKVTKAFANVEVNEYWGLCPVEKTKWNEEQKRDITYCEYELKKVIVGNRKVILAEEKCPYRRIPAFAIRTKKRPYDLYGQGFFLNSTGLQELASSMLCFGFDSSKLASMDIVIMDKSKANDQDSIVVRPLQIWDVKNPQDVRFTRANNGMSALNDAFKGIAFLDSLFQDTTGITRQVSANQSLPGTPGGGEDTLGIYQYQLQMADQRFLDQAKFIEDDFEHPLLHFILDCIMDPALISQDFINEVLGFKAEPVMDDKGQPTGITKNIPVLDQSELVEKLNELRQKDKSADFDFTMIGLTQFIEKINLLKKLDGLIQRATTTQAFASYVKLNEVVKRWFELSEIPDWEDLVQTNAPELAPFPPTVEPNGKIASTPIAPVVPAKAATGGSSAI